MHPGPPSGGVHTMQGASGGRQHPTVRVTFCGDTSRSIGVPLMHCDCYHFTHDMHAIMAHISSTALSSSDGVRGRAGTTMGVSERVDECCRRPHIGQGQKGSGKRAQLHVMVVSNEPRPQQRALGGTRARVHTGPCRLLIHQRRTPSRRDVGAVIRIECGGHLHALDAGHGPRPSARESRMASLPASPGGGSPTCQGSPGQPNSGLGQQRQQRPIAGPAAHLLQHSPYPEAPRSTLGSQGMACELDAASIVHARGQLPCAG